MEIVSVQRKNCLWLLFRFIKVYRERISWRALAGDLVVKTIGRWCDTKPDMIFQKEQLSHAALKLKISAKYIVL